MKFIKTENTGIIPEYRKALYQKLGTPIDAMWELLYIASSQHYIIENEEETIGYCCIDSSDSLLQLYLKDDFNYLIEKVIKTLIDEGLIRSARLSSSEPVTFNICLLHSKSINTNTFCFQHANKQIRFEPTLKLEPVSEEEIPAIKVFLKEEVGMDDTFGYTENLVNRGEIYRAKEGATIIATSECRLSDTQKEYADLGMIVKSDYRGRGLATQILMTQVNRVLEMGRKPICSTTIDNIASRKAIERAGFYCTNIIFDISFK
ncbi:MAG: GNAT family N-acetyltransferase [Chitinophagales bacterium]|nr:GNAT family N-acetyltransferase [Chitinophagales bacterium]